MQILQRMVLRSNHALLPFVGAANLEGYALRALRPRPLLASRGCHLGAWCLHFGTLGHHFGAARAPWMTMGAAGWIRGGRPEQDFHRFLGQF